MLNQYFEARLALVLVVFTSISASTQLKPKPKHPAAAPTGATCGSHCGTERWALKTLTDSGSAAVTSSALKASSVSSLVAEQAPVQLPQSTRISPIENQQFTIQAILIAWKQEAGAKGDQDFHLVIADPQDHTKTMIAEIPSPQCASACASASKNEFAAARQVLITELGPAPHSLSATPVVPPRKVELTGVGFFDFDHGQDGLAPNCIEIHPVLKITVQGKEGTGAIDLPTGIAHTCVKTAGGHPKGGAHKPHGGVH